MRKNHKDTFLHMRISEVDKMKLEKLAEYGSMSMSEYVTYMIRRDYNNAFKSGEQKSSIDN